MLKSINILLFALALFNMCVGFYSCTSDSANYQYADNDTKNRNKENLEKVNKYLMLQEKQLINEYIGSRNIQFVETGTGLRYCIVNQGDGELVKKGNIIALDYEVRLLNGDMLYSSDTKGLKVFVVGHGGVESGLEEAVLHLRKGDEAEIIIPSHLAYGLLGDGDMIPPKATIVYKVKVIENQINS